ncbi:mRNA guanylyltransferase [Plasmodiophora brassicae]
MSKRSYDDMANRLPFDLPPPSVRPFDAYVCGASDADVNRVRVTVNRIVFGSDRVRRNDFPGPLPATVGRCHLQQFARVKYWVTEKSDGERRFLLILPDATFLIDRKWSVLKVTSSFYQDTCRADLPVLLDGELMNPEGTHALYLAYDCMNLGARRLTDAPFSERIAAFEKVAERYRTAVPDDDLSAHDHPFRIASKFFVPQVEIVRILHKIHPHMGSYRFVDLKRRRVNKNDGLIFVADVDKYRPEKPTTLMKWKWPDKNSVDFIVRAPFFNDRGELELRCGSYHNQDMVVRRITVDNGTRTQFLSWVQGRNELVIECVYDRQGGIWRLCHPRYDKHKANFVTVVIQTMESLIDNVTKDDLSRACQHYREPAAA